MGFWNNREEGRPHLLHLGNKRDLGLVFQKIQLKFKDLFAVFKKEGGTHGTKREVGRISAEGKRRIITSSQYEKGPLGRGKSGIKVIGIHVI